MDIQSHLDRIKELRDAKEPFYLIHRATESLRDELRSGDIVSTGNPLLDFCIFHFSAGNPDEAYDRLVPLTERLRQAAGEKVLIVEGSTYRLGTHHAIEGWRDYDDIKYNSEEVFGILGGDGFEIDDFEFIVLFRELGKFSRGEPFTPYQNRRSVKKGFGRYHIPGYHLDQVSYDEDKDCFSCPDPSSAQNCSRHNIPFDDHKIYFGDGIMRYDPGLYSGDRGKIISVDEFIRRKKESLSESPRTFP